MKKALLLLCCCSVAASAQKILNQRAEPQGEKIVITYDLSGVSGDTYDISIFSSHNNFTAALAQVTGDVGNGIRGGTGKRIEWNAKSELGAFKGKLRFEIRALVIAHLGFTTSPNSARRGKDVSVGWRGGHSDNKIKIELLRGGAIQSTINNLDNTGSHTWALPADQSVGKDYQLRLTDGKETVTSGTFPVNRKVPLLLKAVPVVLAGVLVVVLLKPTPQPDDKLANPPDLSLE